MKIVLAPDSFKGTFSSMEIIEMLSEGCKIHFPDAEIVKIPMADGGEGTVDAFVHALGFQEKIIEVTGPLGEAVQAMFGMKGETAVIEMAQASGLCLLDRREYNPLETSTYGTGELIKAALDAGAKHILIGIGGSATNDGGMGMARALGIRFLDDEGRLLSGCGKDLERVNVIDAAGLDPRVLSCELTAICDVTNPLTGPMGATRVYGPQKGADGQMIECLEAGMVRYKALLNSYSGMDVNDMAGSGAAGGLGAGISVLLGGHLQPGIDAILSAVDFDSVVKDADFVITGEGRLDEQSVFGKVPCGIGRRCKDLQTKVFVLAGSVSGDPVALYDCGIDGIYSVISEPCLLEEALMDASCKMTIAIDGLLRLIKAGMQIRQ